MNAELLVLSGKAREFAMKYSESAIFLSVKARRYEKNYHITKYEFFFQTQKKTQSEKRFANFSMKI